MSTQSRVVLGASFAVALSLVAYVHLKQEWERAKLHEGVLKDLQRQQFKKSQSQQDVIELNCSEKIVKTDSQ